MHIIVLSNPVELVSHPPHEINDQCCVIYWGYRGGSPTTVQAWRTCPLWEPSSSHPH